jgi:quinone-modifying oxidoreductase, subunit QmoB
MADNESKVGIYICSGCDIGNCVDVDALMKTAEKECKAPVFKAHSFLCGAEGVEIIRKDIAEGVNKVVVCGCSSRINTEAFHFGPEIFVERVPIREFVTWCHEPNDEDTQMIAEDYVRMAGAKAEKALPPTALDEEIAKRILVIGGGVAGMTAALSAAKAGYETVLVEKEAELGGWAGKYTRAFPKKAPYTDLQETGVAQLVKETEDLDRLKVYTSSTIGEIDGQPGQFDVTINNGSGSAQERIGAVVLASGWNPYDAEKLGHLGQGVCKNVVTNIDIEKMAKEGEFLRPSDGKAVKSVAFIQCAGSRDEDHLPYCSGVCCRVSLKQAKYIREKYPDAKVYIIYKDLRSPAQYELFYSHVQEDEGIFLTKGEVASVTAEGDDRVTVAVDDTLLGESIEITADMVVLATGMVPTTRVDEPDTAADTSAGAEAEGGDKAADGNDEDEDKAAGAEMGAQILNLTYRQGTDLPTLKYGFPDSHFICFPYETRRTGIYAAGAVRAPQDSAASAADGRGAAMKAIQSVEMLSRGEAVHPRAGDVSYPDFNLQRCTQCKRCTEECPFGTLNEDEKGTPEINLLRCRRCGICTGSCPERIVSFTNHSVQMTSAIIKTIEIPDEEEEKPRVLVFVCENDALPALETTALKRMKYSPHVRFMPLRCIGNINIIWIADALSAGFDGVMLLGCKRGDDYQCHFVKGSELADYRMGNVQDKLKQLVLEEERVRILEVAIDDYDKIPRIIDDYIEEIEEIGPNPYKGF